MEKCLFIYNPNSGKSKNKKRIDYIIKRLCEIYGDIDVFPTQYPKHATEISKTACGKYKYLIISGGDGTFSEVINGIAEEKEKPIIGYIPAGTVNDISRSLNIPRNYKKALNILEKNYIFEHDIFQVNNSFYGIYFCGAGLFTSSSYATRQRSKRFWGKIAYFFHGVKDLFTIKNFNVKLQDETGNITSGRFVLLLIINSRSVAGFKLNKKANLQDGKIDIVLIKRKKSFFSYIASLLTIAKLFLFGKESITKSKRATILCVNNFSVEINKKLNINIDGEKALNGDFNCKVLNKSIKIIIPQKEIKK